MLVDRLAHRRGRPQFEKTTFYGRLHHIIRVDLPVEPDAQLERPTSIAFGLVSQCDIEEDHAVLDVHYYRKEHAALDVVDLDYVMCLVGRVPLDGHRWAIIDRSASGARTQFVDEAGNEFD